MNNVQKDAGNRLSCPTVDDAEVEKFDAAATTWWDPRGSSGWLHRYNPLRVAYIRDAACRQYGRDPTQVGALRGLRVLDIGCGAGVLCEALAKLHATVVGADPAENLVQLARLHAMQSEVQVDYRCATAEALAASGEQFDVVLAMEVVEHVAESAIFIQRCAELVKPGGLAILSTINRTFMSFLFAIVMGEYVLRLLPLGTHQWKRFVRPGEIESTLARNGFRTVDLSGVTLNLHTAALQLSRNFQVNYLLTFERPKH